MEDKIIDELKLAIDVERTWSETQQKLHEAEIERLTNELNDFKKVCDCDNFDYCIADKTEIAILEKYRDISQEMYIALMIANESFGGKTWAKQGAHITINNAIEEYIKLRGY